MCFPCNMQAYLVGPQDLVYELGLHHGLVRVSMPFFFLAERGGMV